VRFGLAGLGWAARSFQLPALKQVPGAVVVGGCDPSQEQRASFERETGIETYVDLDELLHRAAPDVVVVATPPDSHAALCIRALEGGAHVVCEKPFVSSVDEADRVLAAASAAGRSVAVNHEFREKAIFKAVKDDIGGPDVGRLVFCQIWQLMDLAPWDEPVAWRAAMPNRTLFEGGVHLVDLLIHLFGALPDAVFARHSSGLGDADRTGDADAIHLVTFEFPEGRLAQITINRLSQGGTRYVDLRADCEHASLRASLGGRATIQIGKKRAERGGVRLDYGPGGLAWRERGLKRKTLARGPRQPGMHATAILLRGVVTAIEEGREPPSSGREARDVLAVIEAAYLSAATGERIQLEWAAERPMETGEVRGLRAV
jgi:predicted dehydrogenase